MEEMNAEMMQLGALQVGQVVKGKVIKVEEKQALVDIGYKVDATLPIGEVSSVHIEKVGDVLHEGDEIEVQILRIQDEEDRVVVSKRAVDSEKAWEDLERKFETGEVFEAVVANVVKGGLVVDVGVRGFIPASMVETHFVEDFSDYKGKPLTLKVVELDREKNKVILSHRAVLEKELGRKKAEVLQNLQVGSIIEGTVQRLTDFGAFVDIGGVDGLVHVSEMAWNHVAKPSDVVKEGEKVRVKVLKVDPENERISLSIKETLPGPWDEANERFNPGDIVEGTVKRLVSFGAFVELIPGVEGLVHISQIANRHVATPQEVLEVGQKVKVKILDINLTEQRISLSIKQVEDLSLSHESFHDHSDSDSGMNVTLGDMFGDQLRRLR